MIHRRDRDAEPGLLESTPPPLRKMLWRPGLLCRQCGEPMRGLRGVLVCDWCDSAASLK